MHAIPCRAWLYLVKLFCQWHTARLHRRKLPHEPATTSLPRTRLRSLAGVDGQNNENESD